MIFFFDVGRFVVSSFFYLLLVKLIVLVFFSTLNITSTTTGVKYSCLNKSMEKKVKVVFTAKKINQSTQQAIAKYKSRTSSKNQDSNSTTNKQEDDHHVSLTG